LTHPNSRSTCVPNFRRKLGSGYVWAMRENHQSLNFVR
jgi:hypothetical protein